MITDKDIKSEIINIGPEENYITINELFEKISNKLKFNENAIYYEDRPNEVKHAQCSSKKAEKLLNYKTQYSVDDSLDAIIEYIKKRGAKDFVYSYDLEINNEKTPDTWKNKIF